MSGKDVVHLLIILGVGWYSFIGSMTESGLGGWMNDARFQPTRLRLAAEWRLLPQKIKERTNI